MRRMTNDEAAETLLSYGCATGCLLMMAVLAVPLVLLCCGGLLLL